MPEQTTERVGYIVREGTVGRLIYDRGIKAWLADRDAGLCLSTEFWEPREYIIRAIDEALRAKPT